LIDGAALTIHLPLPKDVLDASGLKQGSAWLFRTTLS
jgi:hypothetical protein